MLRPFSGHLPEVHGAIMIVRSRLIEALDAVRVPRLDKDQFHSSGSVHPNPPLAPMRLRPE
jgi:hypothetical protein